MRCWAWSAGLALMVMPVSAADLYLRPSQDYPPIVYREAVGDWTGLYAGLYGSYIGASMSSRGLTSGNYTDVPTHGAGFGLTLGGNHQSGAFVMGLEGDIGWSGARGSITCAGVSGFDCAAEKRWTATLRGRVGFAAHTSLFYGTAGLALAEGYGASSPRVANVDGVYHTALVGWTVGAGIETRVSQSVSIKGEYNYVDYSAVTAPAGALGVQAFDVDAHAHIAKLGVNYHF